MVNEVSADVQLPELFSDNMVLQQRSKVIFWGGAVPGQTVTIQPSWDNKIYSVKVQNNGQWQTTIDTPGYGGPYIIRISEGNTIQLNNVMIGEVWLCSGQSNMAMQVGGSGKVLNFKEEIKNADYPDIRFFNHSLVKSNIPVEERKKNDQWEVCSPESVDEFSAVAYFFGREIYRKTGIPVGLVHSSWGGTDIEAWISREGLQSFPDIYDHVMALNNLSEENLEQLYQKKIKGWEEELFKIDKGYNENIPSWALDIHDSDWGKMVLPGYWDKHGLQAFNGVIWYRKLFDLPSNFISGELLLSLGNIDDDDITYVNGVKVGETKGHRIQRQYKIPNSLLKEKGNTIAVRVYDIRGTGGFYGSRNNLFLSNGKDKLDLSGEWKYKISFSSDQLPRKPLDPKSSNNPSVLYNGMINPLRKYKIKGVIWYQGENNTSRAYEYQNLFSTLINDWRSKFDSGQLPFYFVQLANHLKKDSLPEVSQWAELREAQLATYKTVPNTGMAVAIDIGEENDIHPKNKQDVGKRLAIIALNKLYNKNIEYSGPIIKSCQIEDGKIKLKFDHDRGLYSRNGALSGFAIAGEDKQFHWAEAHISENEVIVSANAVKKPVAVRYAWGNNPEANLYNDSHLPASPFRTDNWKLTTEK